MCTHFLGAPSVFINTVAIKQKNQYWIGSISFFEFEFGSMLLSDLERLWRQYKCWRPKVIEGFECSCVCCSPLALLNLGSGTFTSAQLIKVKVLNSSCLGVCVFFLASEVHPSDYLVSRDIEENQQHRAYPQAEMETAPDTGEPAVSGCWTDGIFYLKLWKDIECEKPLVLERQG